MNVRWKAKLTTGLAYEIIVLTELSLKPYVLLWEVQHAVLLELDPYLGVKNYSISQSLLPMFLFFMFQPCLTTLYMCNTHGSVSAGSVKDTFIHSS